MAKMARLALLSTFCFGTDAIVARADDVPRYDMARTCRAESQPTEDKKNTEACLKDEREAHDQLSKEWEQFAVGRSTCLALGNDPGSVQSYIELLSCLQDARQAATMPKR
jgi:hypothetical protein